MAKGNLLYYIVPCTAEGDGGQSHDIIIILW